MNFTRMHKYMNDNVEKFVGNNDELKDRIKSKPQALLLLYFNRVINYNSKFREFLNISLNNDKAKNNVDENKELLENLKTVKTALVKMYINLLKIREVFRSSHGYSEADKLYFKKIIDMENLITTSIILIENRWSNRLNIEKAEKNSLNIQYLRTEIASYIEFIKPRNNTDDIPMFDAVAPALELKRLRMLKERQPSPKMSVMRPASRQEPVAIEPAVLKRDITRLRRQAKQAGISPRSPTRAATRRTPSPRKQSPRTPSPRKQSPRKQSPRKQSPLSPTIKAVYRHRPLPLSPTPLPPPLYPQTIIATLIRSRPSTAARRSPPRQSPRSRSPPHSNKKSPRQNIYPSIPKMPWYQQR